MKRPVLYLLSFIAYIIMPIGVVFANRVEPYVLGLPFLLFWMVLCIFIGTGIMTIIYQFVREEEEGME
ncbi:hypothetical protein WQ54_11125 [Bacillus sp. SA1-12]|uniref:DUF3311 domain-containing protein n=1 Tax=Bacillus sp. SA1-12 TaxID=1455638 RepID=UPI000626329A|nr:DUF3311 domain-containing protein [Bacillus sp. SA1-12]KKI92121.1 hypothetical protein WQ54_11125 [Bacillus sp. SA1-12]